MKKAILNRKITPYNIESHLKGLVGNMSAKEYKKLVVGNKQDIYKKFFVETNKPVSTLPENSDLKLSYQFNKKQDHEVISPEVSKLHRRSMTDLKFSKLKSTLDIGKKKPMLPSIHSSRSIRKTKITSLHPAISKYLTFNI